MKKIKLRYLGFWPEFNETDNVYFNILNKHFDVEITDTPDYVIASMYCSPFIISEYGDCLRILHSGEDYFPDMNIFDFGVGYNHCRGLLGVTRKGLIERYFRWPFGCEWNLDAIINETREKDVIDAERILNRKDKFCNFIYGHRSYKGEREKLYDAISNYKRVDSFGSYLNNMSDGLTICRPEKIRYMKNYKFTIAAETLRYPGMTTEKIFDAYVANSIPIYFGDPCVKDTFNSETFIEWDGKEKSLSNVIEAVESIDNNDELYIQMLTKRKIKIEKGVEPTLEAFEKWLVEIFSLEKDDAMQHIPGRGPSQRCDFESYYRKANRLQL